LEIDRLRKKVAKLEAVTLESFDPCTGRVIESDSM